MMAAVHRRQGRSPPSQRRVWGPWATVMLGLAIAGAYVGTAALTLLALVLAERASHPAFDLWGLIDQVYTAKLGLLVAVAGIATAIVGTSLIVLFVKLRTGISVAEYLGLRPFRAGALLLWLVITSGILAASYGAGLLLERSGDQPDLRLYTTTIWPPLLWIAIIVFGPVFEEAFFRGFLFEGLRQSRVGALGTVVVTAGVWSLLHLYSYGIFPTFTIFLFGLALGIARLKSGSLWIPLLMHAFWNSLVLLILVFRYPGLFG